MVAGRALGFAGWFGGFGEFQFEGVGRADQYRDGLAVVGDGGRLTGGAAFRYLAWSEAVLPDRPSKEWHRELSEL